MYKLIKQCNNGERWCHLLLNWSPISPIFTTIFSLPPGPGFREKMKNQWRSVLICWYMKCSLATGDIHTSWSPCSDSPLPTTECLQATPSVSSSVSWDGPVYSAATFPATFSLQTGVKRENNNKRNEAQGGANDCSGFASQRVSCYSWR